jgi:transcriptional regulator with XRE-family HTH domain
MMSGEDWDAVVGLAIAVRRRKLSLTQEMLAGAAHIHRNYLADVEHGKKSLTIGVFCEVARALQVSPETLLKQASSYRSDDALREAAVASLPPRRPGRPART